MQIMQIIGLSHLLQFYSILVRPQWSQSFRWCWAIFWGSSALSQPLWSRSTAQSTWNGPNSLSFPIKYWGEQAPRRQRAVAQVRLITLFGAVRAIAGSDPMRGLKDFGPYASGGNPAWRFHSDSWFSLLLPNTAPFLVLSDDRHGIKVLRLLLGVRSGSHLADENSLHSDNIYW